MLLEGSHYHVMLKYIPELRDIGVSATVFKGTRLRNLVALSGLFIIDANPNALGLQDEGLLIRLRLGVRATNGCT